MITYSIASDYTFNVSVSTTTYENKEAFVAASKKLVYRKQPVSIDTMCQFIKEGHSFCHCYDDNDEPFTNRTKTQANFRYTSCIAYDIDDNALPMEDEKCDWKEMKNLKNSFNGHEWEDVMSYVSGISREVWSSQPIGDRRAADEQVVGCLVGTAEEEQDHESAIIPENSQCDNGERGKEMGFG